MEKVVMEQAKHICERVMVCGATGFIGAHVVAELIKAGYKDIHIISRTIDSCANLERVLKYNGLYDKYENIHIHYGAITNYEWLKESLVDCHTVYNCAAAVDFIANDTESLISRNVTLAYLVGEACVDMNVKLLVHVSSIAALKAKIAPELTTENSHLETLKGESPYAISKFYSENEIWRIAEKGLRVIVVNPAVVLGYGDYTRSTSPQFIMKMSKGVSFYTSGLMGYVMVEDVARAMVELSICEKAVGERFILCSDNMNYRKMLSIVAEGFGNRAPHIKVSDSLIKFMGKLLRFINWIGIKSKYGEPLMRNLISKHIYDGTKIEGYIDFKYSEMKPLLIKAIREMKMRK